jgi:hypothetical protein
MRTQTRGCNIWRMVCAGAVVAAIAWSTGCASHRSVDDAVAARSAAPVAFEHWPYRGKSALTVRSAHFTIHTTIADRDFLAKLAQLMEGALQQYRLFTPGVNVTDDPLECYVFGKRPEWAEFTAAKTGSDAALYLQINRGGYTVRDWFVAYYIGDVGTYAVAAHEGWHQYVARHFRSRLPPFLEEGIATMFENVRYYGSAPEWDLSPSSHRADKLRHAIESNSLWPLERLITMHAGEVVALPGARIEAFYAQNWAFAEFLWEADDGKYRPALQRLLADCAAGTLYDGNPLPRRRTVFDAWDPNTVKPMLEHYLCMELVDIERAYKAYCRKIAYAGRNAFVPD